MQKPLTQSDLKNQRCVDPGCKDDHPVLYMGAHCHPQGALEASYDKRDGVLTLECAECSTVIVRLAISVGPQ